MRWHWVPCDDDDDFGGKIVGGWELEGDLMRAGDETLLLWSVSSEERIFYVQTAASC